MAEADATHRTRHGDVGEQEIDLLMAVQKVNGNDPARGERSRE
jgi:hypothetical protein